MFLQIVHAEVASILNIRVAYIYLKIIQVRGGMYILRMYTRKCICMDLPVKHVNLSYYQTKVLTVFQYFTIKRHGYQRCVINDNVVVSNGYSRIASRGHI